MKTCYMMCGIPASGKSTLREKMMQTDPNAFVYSTDIYVEEMAKQRGITYSELWPYMINEAQAQMDEWLAVALTDGRNVIWDQTNLGVGKRKKILNALKPAGYRMEAHAIRLPNRGYTDDWKSLAVRLKSRPGKEIPTDVITRMTDSYVLPTIDEGFDTVIYYNIWGERVGGKE